MTDVRTAIQRDRLRDEANFLDKQMAEVKQGVLALKAENATLHKENDRLRSANHEAEVVRRVLKWALSEGVVIARNADRHLFLLDHKICRGAVIPDVYARTIFEVVREIELEAEHAG